MCSSERMTTMSVDEVVGSGGIAEKRTSSARSDSGLFVGAPSVVRLSPRSSAMATTASTITAIHAPIARHGWRALAPASALVDRIMSDLPLVRVSIDVVTDHS